MENHKRVKKVGVYEHTSSSEFVFNKKVSFFNWEIGEFFFLV
jgi:hypothetical protein